MSSPIGPADRQPMSYLGIAACIVFGLGTAIIVYLFVIPAETKMGKLEGIVLLPEALVLYILGIIFGSYGLQDRKRNPFSLMGLVLNAVPICFFLIAFLIHVLI